MLYADFCWDCPRCKKTNWENFANEDDPYKCKGCQKKFYLTFSVEVEEIESHNEETGEAESIHLVDIEVSQDSGETWQTMTVNTRDLNPDTSPLKSGWLLRHNGQTHRLYLHESLKRLQTEKVTA
jgi:hypothetical protein